ncbi:hypothetical protein [Rhodohalobacter sp. 614A]|uniref:hypothetical protein n=1 Tax=Rhodohalobacter sp. 614A TaxID=2908649 RepID=UPI001F308DE6|nr:hypothetical protein [Rhodohalobacter sp. 614A]
MSVPKLSINIGILLTLLGILSFILTDFVSITALIPAFFGVVLAGLGFLAKSSESMRKHAMHAALLLALLGLFGSFSGLIALIGAISGTMPERMSAAVSQSIMAVLCIIFLIAGIKSFIAARKAQ